MQSDILRIVDSIARDKNIDRDIVIEDLEAAIASAIRKANGPDEDVQVVIDRTEGGVNATLNGEQIPMSSLGRIAAQTCKQVMIQKFRDAERGSIFQEYTAKKGTIVTGMVSRFEGGAMLIGLGRVDGFLPRSEQIPGETHQPGERIRTYILDVREAPHQVRIILSRSHPDLIRCLFEQEVPEVAERVIEIKALAREAGYRTKVAVSSIDTKVDAVGACVGVRGSRIKNIVDELGGEKIDIVRWNESSQILITNALKPAEVEEISLCFELGRATAVVQEDQLSLAIGKRGQNVRLAARLTGWDIDILTPKEYNAGMERLEKTILAIEGADAVLVEKMNLLGLINVMDVEEVGVDPLVAELELTEEVAKRIIEVCSAEAKVLQVEMDAAKKVAAAKKAEEAVAGPLTADAPESLTAEGTETPSSEEGIAAAAVTGALTTSDELTPPLTGESLTPDTPVASASLTPNVATDSAPLTPDAPADDAPLTPDVVATDAEAAEPATEKQD